MKNAGLLACVVYVCVVCVCVAEDPLCCTTTSYGSSWPNCNNAANLWNVPSCSTCASYQCIDWTVGSILNQQRESQYTQSTGGDVVYFGVGSYGNNQARAGKCYRITANGVDRDLLVQVRRKEKMSQRRKGRRMVLTEINLRW